MESWEKLREGLVYTGFRQVLKRTFRLPDGRTAEFDIKHEGGGVCVLALTPEHRVVLAKQYRPGPETILFELPGGGAAKGETWAEAIERELLEETGYAGDLQFVGTNFHCAYSSALRRNFVATGCRKVQEPQNEDTEFIQVVEMPLEAFRTVLRNGRLTNVEGAYMALDFLGLL